jgi:hypothetical protein
MEQAFVHDVLRLIFGFICGQIHADHRVSWAGTFDVKPYSSIDNKWAWADIVAKAWHKAARAAGYFGRPKYIPWAWTIKIYGEESHVCQMNCHKGPAGIYYTKKEIYTKEWTAEAYSYFINSKEYLLVDDKSYSIYFRYTEDLDADSFKKIPKIWPVAFDNEIGAEIISMINDHMIDTKSLQTYKGKYIVYHMPHNSHLITLMSQLFNN